MKQVNIKIKGASKINPIFLVDGKKVKFKKNNYGSYEANVETENNKLEIELYRYLEISGRLWWLMSIVFFVISLFGILDSVKEKDCMVLNCKWVVDLSNNNGGVVDIKIHNLKHQQKSVEFVSALPYNEVSNVCIEDATAKKRLKIVKGLKIATVLVVVAIVVLAIAL